MKIIFPRNKVLHKRDFDRELTTVHVLGGNIINWEQMQEIYFAVQGVYDMQDMLNEISCMLKHNDLTVKEAANITSNMDHLVSRYRMLLDEGIGENWNDTLCYVLNDFLENTKEDDA